MTTKTDYVEKVFV